MLIKLICKRRNWGQEKWKDAFDVSELLETVLVSDCGFLLSVFLLFTLLLEINSQTERWLWVPGKEYENDLGYMIWSIIKTYWRKEKINAGIRQHLGYLKKALIPSGGLTMPGVTSMLTRMLSTLWLKEKFGYAVWVLWHEWIIRPACRMRRSNFALLTHPDHVTHCFHFRTLTQKATPPKVTS